MSVNEDLVDYYIDHRLDLLRFEAGVVKQLTAAYEAALLSVVADLRKADAELRAGRLTASTRDLLNRRRKGLRAELAALLDLQTSLMDEALSATVQVELFSNAEAWALARPQGVDISWTKPPVADVLAAVTDPIGGRGWDDRLAVSLKQLHDTIAPTLAAAVARGASMERVADDLTKVEGLVGRKRSDLVALARTEVQRVANVAAEASYAANADVLDGVEYLATLDSRTCVVCAPDHGKTYPLGESPTIPRHPRCRCFIAPVTKSWSALGLGPQQASLFDGKPSRGPDFPAWLKRQPPATADAILGPERAEAWRGGLALDRFSDGRQPLTLAQLRERHPDAFVSP